jgi:phospholipase/lecithinase/hemolysin
VEDVLARLAQLPVQVNVTTPAADALAPGWAAEKGYPASLCLFVPNGECPTLPSMAPPGAYLYWDVEHPTTQVHALLAQYIFGVLTQ